MYPIDQTHDPRLESWIESANDPHSDFPIQNLPYGVFLDRQNRPTIGVAIGDQILDLRFSVAEVLIDPRWTKVVSGESLNSLMALAVSARTELRQEISRLLEGNSNCDRQRLSQGLVEQATTKMLMPAQVRDYTDFYASIFHATNVGMMMRPDNPLLPNYKHIPIGYHGRASSVVVSETQVRRPWGQTAPEQDGGPPGWSPCRLMDYELEVGCFVGSGNSLGIPIDIADAEGSLFGLCLLNDWSARDVQKWEYQPLGPFLAKSFATTISPWVVTMEALAPFRIPEFNRPLEDPAPLPYLDSANNQQRGGIDLRLQVSLSSEKMRAEGMEPVQLSTGKFAGMYWTFAQMLTHHSSNGCNLQPGDLMGSGTVSGPDRENRGCMLELTWDGSVDKPQPGSQRTALILPTGEERKFLADGDEVILTGYCQNETHRRIGMGQCRGMILPAIKLPAN